MLYSRPASLPTFPGPFYCLPDSRPGGSWLVACFCLLLLPLHCQLKFVRSPPDPGQLSSWRANQRLRSSPSDQWEGGLVRWWSVRLAARRGSRATWCLGGSLLASSYLELTPKPLKMVRTTDIKKPPMKGYNGSGAFSHYSQHI